MAVGVLRMSDWKRAAKDDEFAEYIRRSRQRFDRGEEATVRKVRALYRRVANQLHQEIVGMAPGTLRHSHAVTLAGVLQRAAETLNKEIMAAVRFGIDLAVMEAVLGAERITALLTDGVFRKQEIQTMFAAVNQRAVLATLSRTHKDGFKLSDRIWRTSQNARRTLERLVEDAVARGLDARTLARDVQRYLQPGVWMSLKDETRRRLKVPRDVSMEAVRLAVTEMQHAFHEGTVQGYRHVPSCRGFYWRLSASHPIPDICDNFARRGGNGFWEKENVPIKPHPWCRCALVPAMEDPQDFVKRLKSWVNNPHSQPDLENWYNSLAKEFIGRPDPESTIRPKTGSTPPQPPPMSPLVRELTRLGLSRNVAESVENVSELIRQKTIRNDVEYAAMIDAATGQRIGPIIDGEKNEADIGEHIRAMVSGREYIQLHTHPLSSSFSDADVFVMSANDGFKYMVVTGADGTQYILMKNPGAKYYTYQEIHNEYRIVRSLLHSKYANLVQTGQMSPEQAWKEHSHEIWERIASNFDFRYIRILP